MSFRESSLPRRTSTQYLTTEELVSTELPESIGKLTKLQNFQGQYNKLTSEFPRTFLAPSECSTRYLTSFVVDSEVAFLVATENKLPKLSTLDFDICRTEREGGAVSKLDCSSRKVTSEFSRIFFASPKPSTQYLIE